MRSENSSRHECALSWRLYIMFWKTQPSIGRRLSSHRAPFWSLRFWTWPHSSFYAHHVWGSTLTESSRKGVCPPRVEFDMGDLHPLFCCSSPGAIPTLAFFFKSDRLPGSENSKPPGIWRQHHPVTFEWDPYELRQNSTFLLDWFIALQAEPEYTKALYAYQQRNEENRADI